MSAATTLEAQADFAADYRARFPHGFGPGRGHTKETTERASLSAAESYCQQFGFAP